MVQAFPSLSLLCAYPGMRFLILLVLLPMQLKRELYLMTGAIATAVDLYIFFAFDLEVCLTAPNRSPCANITCILRHTFAKKCPGNVL
jgi:hypothetical protein